MIKARFSIRIFVFLSGGQVLSAQIVRRVRKSVSAQLQADTWLRRVFSTAASPVVRCGIYLSGIRAWSQSPRREAEGLSRLHNTITDWPDSGYTRRIAFIPGAPS